MLLRFAGDLPLIGRLSLLLIELSTSTTAASEAAAVEAASTTPTASATASTVAAPEAIDTALAKGLHVLDSLLRSELLATIGGRVLAVLQLARNIIEEA